MHAWVPEDMLADERIPSIPHFDGIRDFDGSAKIVLVAAVYYPMTVDNMTDWLS